MLLSFVTLVGVLANAAVLALLYRRILLMRGAYRDHVSALREECAAKDALVEAHRVRADVYQDLCAEQAGYISLLAGRDGEAPAAGSRPPSIH
jgi:hypothetical protein